MHRTAAGTILHLKSRVLLLRHSMSDDIVQAAFAMLAAHGVGVKTSADGREFDLTLPKEASVPFLEMISTVVGPLSESKVFVSGLTGLSPTSSECAAGWRRRRSHQAARGSKRRGAGGRSQCGACWCFVHRPGLSLVHSPVLFLHLRTLARAVRFFHIRSRDLMERYDDFDEPDVTATFACLKELGASVSIVGGDRRTFHVELASQDYSVDMLDKLLSLLSAVSNSTQAVDASECARACA